MLRRAEVAANRIVQRFHEILDFNSILADEFVVEPKLRERAVSFNDSEAQKRFDAATKERAYVAIMTSLHLWAEYMLVQNVNEIPPEVQKLQPKLKLMQDSTTSRPNTLSEMNEAIEELETVSDLYRRYLSQAAFRGPIYVESITRERERAKANFHNVPRIEKGNKKFGIPESVLVYVVRPEVFDYYFIQEKGAMKLFYVNILPNFKLF